MSRSWTCQRSTAGVRCGHVNPARKRKCEACQKPRPARKRPAHMAALDEPYEVFLRLNGGVEACALCGAKPKARKLHRDHSHRSGKPLGLLCFRCNAALRPYMDAQWLRAAAAYLERGEARETLEQAYPGADLNSIVRSLIRPEDDPTNYIGGEFRPREGN